MKGSNRPLKRKKPRMKRGWLTPEVRNRINREAHSLGLSNQEYIRLLLSFSNLVRSCFPTQQKLNAGQILQLMENPLFSSTFGWLAQSVLSQMTSSSKDDEESESSKPAEPERQTQPTQQPSQGQAQPLHPNPMFREQIPPFQDIYPWGY